MFRIFLLTLILTGLSFADGPILKTGQVMSYDGSGGVVTDGSVKDDGYYQAGKARSYGRSGDIVIDNATGLEWEDNETVQRKWEDGETYPAAEYCASFDLGGHTDWRLPLIQELFTLPDASQYDPSVAERIFSHIVSSYYVSSTTYLGNPEYARFLYFYYGRSDYTIKTGSNYVRCVRGVQLEPSDLIRNDVTEIVTDHTTGLQWQDDSEAAAIEANWEAAIDYCEDTLALGGYTDWRLPNRNELLSIVDYTRHSPTINSLVFDNISLSGYWTSTSHTRYTNYGWTVRFDNGISGYSNDKGREYYVRCVRGGQVDTSNFNPSIIMYLLN